MADQAVISQRTGIVRKTSFSATPTFYQSTEVLGAELTFKPKPETKTHRAQNQQFAGAVTLERDWTEIALGGSVSYNELPFWLTGIGEYYAPTTPGGATLTRRWTTYITNTPGIESALFSIERGTTARSARVGSAFLVDYGQTWGRKSGLGHSGSLLATEYLDQHVWSLKIDGATGGTFTLTVNGQTTSALAYDITAANLKTAIEALSNIEAGGVTITRPGLATVSVIAFTGSTIKYAGVTEMTVNYAALTPSGTATATLSTLACDSASGLSRAAAGLIPLSGRADVRIAATQAALAAATPLDRAFKVDWKLGGRYNPIWPIQSSVDSMAGRVQATPTGEGTLLIGADDTGMDLLNTLRRGERFFLSITHTGPLIETGFNYSFTTQLCLALKTLEIKGEEGLQVADVKGEIAYDSTWGYAWHVSVDCITTVI